MNYKDGGKVSCITGAHAGLLYTNYQSRMSQNCDVIPNRKESSYVYSVIGKQCMHDYALASGWFSRVPVNVEGLGAPGE